MFGRRHWKRVRAKGKGGKSEIFRIPRLHEQTLSCKSGQHSSLFRYCNRERQAVISNRDMYLLGHCTYYYFCVDIIVNIYTAYLYPGLYFSVSIPYYAML